MATNKPLLVNHQFLYYEEFRYSNALDGAATASIPEWWISEPVGSFDTSNSFVLRARDVGELIYNGTPLDQLQIRNTLDDANYAISWSTIGRANAIFELRGRRQDDENYIAFEVDFINQSVSLKSMAAGVETILDTSTKTLRCDPLTPYTFALWVFNNNVYGLVNDSERVSAISSLFRNKHGFSISVPSIDIEDPVAFSAVKVQEIVEQPEDTADDYDLIVQFRRMLKFEIENPDVRTWETYKRAKKLYDRYKGAWHSEYTWAQMGIPIKEPTTEDWFG